MPYVKEISGTWILKGDTLTLYSAKFPVLNQQPSELYPADEYNKYTEIEGSDIYLIKGKKLLIMTKIGHRKDCFLQRQTRELCSIWVGTSEKKIPTKVKR